MEEVGDRVAELVVNVDHNNHFLQQCYLGQLHQADQIIKLNQKLDNALTQLQNINNSLYLAQKFDLNDDIPIWSPDTDSFVKQVESNMLL
jgi:hypothetical protein